MKREDKKDEDKKLDPEVIEQFKNDTLNALQALNERLSKESKK